MLIITSKRSHFLHKGLFYLKIHKIHIQRYIVFCKWNQHEKQCVMLSCPQVKVPNKMQIKFTYFFHLMGKH